FGTPVIVFPRLRFGLVRKLPLKRNWTILTPPRASAPIAAATPVIADCPVRAGSVHSRTPTPDRTRLAANKIASTAGRPAGRCGRAYRPPAAPAPPRRADRARQAPGRSCRSRVRAPAASRSPGGAVRPPLRAARGPRPTTGRASNAPALASPPPPAGSL